MKAILKTVSSIAALLLFVFQLNTAAKAISIYSTAKSSTYSKDTEGDWKAKIEKDKIKFQLYYEHPNSGGHSNISLEVGKDDISNFGYDKEITFQLKRESGTISFTGKFSSGKGKGEFEFSPNSGFNSFLVDKGIGKVKEEELLLFFCLDITKDYVNGLFKLGYNDITASQLSSFAIFRVTLDFIKDIRAAGFKNISAQKLVDFRIFKVTPEFIKEMASSGIKNLKPQNLIDFKIFNVTNKFIEKVKKIKNKKELSAGYIVNAKIVGLRLADDDDDSDDNEY